MVRSLSLVLLLAIACWALWPREASQGGDKSAGARSTEKRKYTIRVAPGMYMPGRRPMDVGSPLKGLDTVASEFEKLYPDTRIEFSEAPVGQREYLVTQLAAEQAPEVLNVNVEDVWQDVQKGWYVPLDAYLELPNPFIPKGEPGSKQWWDQFKYQAISRGKAAPDKKMYCITYDMVETGIFYNKDIFKRLGLNEPKDWPDFIAIQKKVQAAGLIPLIVGKDAIADWGMDVIFDQLYGEIIAGIDLTEDENRVASMPHYLDWDEIAFLNKKGFFTRRDPRFMETFRLLKAWREYWPKNMSTDLMKMFASQQGAMLWDGSWAVNKLTRDPDLAFEWGVFYLPAIPRTYNKFADGHRQTVIGGSGTQLEITNSAFDDTHDRATSIKLKRTVAFLQYMTIPKNTSLVVNEVLAFLPNVVGAEPHKELLPFHEFLQRDTAPTKWLFTFDLRFNEIYKRMLDLYLNGGLSESEFMDWMESNLSTASDTVVKRKGIDLSSFEPKWQEKAPLRAGMTGLPSEK